MIRISRFLALILRHNPAAGRLRLDAEGWADVEDVLAAVRRKFGSFSPDDLARLVETDGKRRYALSADGRKIRASQGHSVDIDLGLAPVDPPPLLYHGTKRQFLESILTEGLRPGKRRHVHLSADVETAQKVGDRRAGETVILTVRCGDMEDHPFYLSANGVWLTDHVPPSCLDTVASPGRVEQA